MVVAYAGKILFGQSLQDSLSFGALQGQEGCGVRLVHDLDIEISGLLFHPGKVFIDVARVDDQHVVVFSEMVNNQVVDGATVGKPELCIDRLVIGKAGNIIGNKVLQERECVRAFDFEFAHVTDIEKTGMGTYCTMFVQDATILYGHLKAAELYDARAQRNMLLVKRGAFQRGRCRIMCCHSLHSSVIEGMLMSVSLYQILEL